MLITSYPSTQVLIILINHGLCSCRYECSFSQLGMPEAARVAEDRDEAPAASKRVLNKRCFHSWQEPDEEEVARSDAIETKAKIQPTMISHHHNILYGHDAPGLICVMEPWLFLYYSRSLAICSFNPCGIRPEVRLAAELRRRKERHERRQQDVVNAAVTKWCGTPFRSSKANLFCDLKWLRRQLKFRHPWLGWPKSAIRSCCSFVCSKVRRRSGSMPRRHQLG